jgi:2-C-methyl-D-erythritol 2,4-cyclodiphosphate synthase
MNSLKKIRFFLTFNVREKIFMEYIYRTGIGQDSHRFSAAEITKPCKLGGIVFEEEMGFSADSDGDVVYHSICNAISSLTHVPILGGVAIELCRKDGVTDSQVYLEEAVKTLGLQEIVHVAISVEGKKPKLQRKIDEMRKKIASVLKIQSDQVGITVTSGDGLTDFGCGEGVQCFCLLTVREKVQ